VNVIQQRKISEEVITLQAQHQQAVIIHPQSKQMLTLKSGRSISLSTISPHWGASIQKLASNDRQRELISRVLAKQELIYKEHQEIVSIPIVARRLLQTTTALQVIEKQKKDKVNEHERSTHTVQHSSTTRQQHEHIKHEHRIIKPMITQHMATLHSEKDRQPAVMNVAKQPTATMRQLERATAQPTATMRQFERTAAQPTVIRQLEQTTAQVAVIRQHERTTVQASTMRQLERTTAQQVAMHQLERTAALPAVMRQTTRSNSMMNSHLSHAASSKPIKATETIRQDGHPENQVAQPLSLKRIELDTVKKHVSLLVKDEKKVQQKQQTEPITVMQSHIKKLEEQIQQQQQLLLEARNPMAVKQLSNQIYAELSRKIKFDQQRLGR